MIRRHLRPIVTAAAALALLGAGLAVALPAHADTTSFQDGFEGNPHAQWTSVEVRGKSLVFLNNTVERRSGSNAAWLIAGPVASEAARIWRQGRIDRPSGQIECAGGMYMRKAGGQRTPQEPGTVTVHLRDSIGQAPIWTGVFPADNFNYRLYSFGFIPYRSVFVIDITAVNDVMIDDLSIQCHTVIR
jgi:hypothetical protein